MKKEKWGLGPIPNPEYFSIKCKKINYY